ncbi:MAG TPA: hypothetical protein PLN21_09515 [Gemmatales bacterium]|nr:hypothetical protein [Gemmatales bacterium]
MKRNAWLREMTRALSIMVAGAVVTVAVAADDPKSVLALPLVPATKTPADTKNEISKELSTPTHDKLAEIKIKAKHSGNALQTLCADANGNILAVVAPPRYGQVSKTKMNSEIQVFDQNGKTLRQWEVPFTAQSIAVGPNGQVYVAGDAHVAMFEADGKLIKDVELPHISKMSSNVEGMKKDAEAQIKQEKLSFEQSTKQIKDMKTKLEAKKEEDRTARDKQMITQYDQILKSYEEQGNFYTKRTVDDVVKETLTRLRYINAVAVNEKDIFIVCGETKGWGYAVWRMNHEFGEPKQVMAGLGGCCGQMDLCCEGDNLIVAENTQKKFARYSRDGKSMGKWGKAGDKDVSCFGGCCNPMNVRASGKGDIFTSESEGYIKRFSAAGEFMGIVGKVDISGGCKNVAIAATPDEERVYFCDQPGNRIFILAKKKNVVQK